MKTYDLYGIAAVSLEEAREIVEVTLRIHMQAHESGYHGGVYYRMNDVGSEHFLLKRNYDDCEVEWAEPQHKEWPFLLYVNETARSNDVRALFSSVTAASLLRHRTV